MSPYEAQAKTEQSWKVPAVTKDHLCLSQTHTLNLGWTYNRVYCWPSFTFTLPQQFPCSNFVPTSGQGSRGQRTSSPSILSMEAGASWSDIGGHE